MLYYSENPSRHHLELKKYYSKIFHESRFLSLLMETLEGHFDHEVILNGFDLKHMVVEPLRLEVEIAFSTIAVEKKTSVYSNFLKMTPQQHYLSVLHKQGATSFVLDGEKNNLGINFFMD